MYTKEKYSLKDMLLWTRLEIFYFVGVSCLVTVLFEMGGMKWLQLPWTPLALIGTAVAFLIGFQNNAAYGRAWEARKIWGGIVNDSRSWGMMVDSFVTNLFANEKVSDEEIYSIKKRLIYRHIAWLYAHRSQLLLPTPWEHISQGGHIARRAKYYQENF